MTAATVEARAGEEQEVDLASRHIDEFAYDKAAARLERMLDPQAPACAKTPELSPAGCRLTERGPIRRARGLYTIALYNLKRPNDAKAQFRQLLLDDPTFTPSPAEYSPEVIRLFTEAKKDVEDEITARTIELQKKQKAYEEAVKDYDAWIDETEKLARTESVVVERSRFIAAVPFGVGQFQNDNVGLGILFLSLETGFLGTSVVTGIMYEDLVGRSIESEADATQTNQQLETLRIVNIASVSLLAATVIAGIIEAEVSFEDSVPKTRVRPLRKRPPKPVPPPTRVGIGGVPDAPDAVGVGVTIQF